MSEPPRYSLPPQQRFTQPDLIREVLSLLTARQHPSMAKATGSLLCLRRVVNRRPRNRLSYRESSVIGTADSRPIRCCGRHKAWRYQDRPHTLPSSRFAELLIRRTATIRPLG